eukprot:2607933-Pleurochrysis_carterae.AAC.1
MAQSSICASAILAALELCSRFHLEPRRCHHVRRHVPMAGRSRAVGAGGRRRHVRQRRRLRGATRWRRRA